MSTKRHYTIDDLYEARDDERSKLVVWRHEVIRELKARLRGTQDGQRPRRPAGAGVTLKTFHRGK
jgi:hypothetical protein